jgi:hypothetical protein
VVELRWDGGLTYFSWTVILPPILLLVIGIVLFMRCSRTAQDNCAASPPCSHRLDYFTVALKIEDIFLGWPALMERAALTKEKRCPATIVSCYSAILPA